MEEIDVLRKKRAGVQMQGAKGKEHKRREQALQAEAYFGNQSFSEGYSKGLGLWAGGKTIF